MRLSLPRFTLCSRVLAIAGLSLICAACAHSPAVDSSEIYKIAVKLPKSQFQPGEAVAATVTLTNLKSEAVKTRKMNFDSLEFYIHPVKEEKLSLRRFPVYSALESKPRQYMVEETIGAGASTLRDFLFTRMTEEPGDYTLAVGYDPNRPKLPMPSGGLKAQRPTMPVVWSDPVSYTVKGSRLFARDSQGILLKEEAIRIAEGAFGQPHAEPRAHLFWNLHGFLEWWVRLDPLQGGQSKAWFIHPYLGRLTGDAPLDPPATQPARQRDRMIRRASGAAPESRS